METIDAPTNAERKAEARFDGDPLLEITDLEVTVESKGEARGQTIVTGVSFSVWPGEVVAVVGESGSGKSTVCHAVVGLLAQNLSVSQGTVTFKGRNLIGLSDRQLRAVRGRQIGMVFQDPLAALNGVRKIGRQLIESRIIHGIDKRSAARRWAEQTVEQLGFKDPKATLDAYPGTLSGGMRQRICVGIAFSAEPEMVIADEPTTALDVSLQGRLLRVLLQYAQTLNSSVLLVSHDIGVVRAVSNRIVVMYGGRVLETGPTDEVMADPRSPYTKALLEALPTLDPARRGHDLATIQGETAPSELNGCPFASRCARALPQCSDTFPTVAGDGVHDTWCWNPVPEKESAHV
jgi:oligopeptide/dipeptide ABC transporter ATP-binding protein